MGSSIVLWLGIMPFVMLYSVYEGPKVFWLWIGGFCLAFVWLYRAVKRKPIPFHNDDIWYLTWLGILTLTSLFGLHPWDSIIGGSYRHQGVLFFFSLYLVLLAIRILKKQELYILNTLLAVGGLIESVFVLVQKYSAWYSRPMGTLGEPNAVGGYLAISMCWLWKVHLRNLWLKIPAMVLLGLAIVATESRTAILCAVFVITGIVYSEFRNGRLGEIKNKFVVGIFSIIVAVTGIITAVSITRPASIYESRPLFWRLGFEQLMNRPLFGYGAETGEVIYDRAYLTINTRLGDFMVDRSHNIFLDVALWSGIVGLIIFLLWMVKVLRKSINRSDYIRSCAYVAWIVFACFQPIGVVHWIQFILLTAL